MPAIHPKTGKVLAGASAADGKGFRNSMAEMMRGYRVGTSTVRVNHGMIGAIAAEVMAQAIVRAAVNARRVRFRV